MRALERELGKAPDELKLVGAMERSYSNTWELQGRSASYILKWLPLRAQREVELARLCRHVFAAAPMINTPRVACSPTPDTFLVEKLAGVPLQAECTAPPLWGFTSWLESRRLLLGRVGTWLRMFHSTAVSPVPAPLTGVKAYVRNREAAFDAIGFELAHEFQRALERAVSLAPVRVHGDFTPHNVLVSGDTVAVIDLAGISEFETETRCFDAATMIVGLEESWRLRTRNHLRFFPSPMREMIATFLRSSGVSGDDGPLPICYAVRHLTRAYNILRKTGKVPGPHHWHVQRIRLALERPEIICQLVRSSPD